MYIDFNTDDEKMTFPQRLCGDTAYRQRVYGLKCQRCRMLESYLYLFGVCWKQHVHKTTIPAYLYTTDVKSHTHMLILRYHIEPKCVLHC